jgi:hypothetical protein
LHFTNQTISFTVYYCIAYYFSLHIPIEQSTYFLAPLHLHIYFQFCILTHTLCLTTTWWGWGHKANLFTLQVVWRRTGRVLVHTGLREFDRQPSSHLHGENCVFLCSTLYSWSLNLAEASLGRNVRCLDHLDWCLTRIQRHELHVAPHSPGLACRI